jgi:hypothetical protein
MIKSFLKFSLIVIVSQIITYYIAGIIAQVVLGASEFYPPSPNAISYLFAAITFVEVLIQTLLMEQIIVRLDRRLIRR